MLSCAMDTLSVPLSVDEFQPSCSAAVDEKSLMACAPRSSLRLFVRWSEDCRVSHKKVVEVKGEYIGTSTIVNLMPTLDVLKGAESLDIRCVVNSSTCADTEKRTCLIILCSVRCQTMERGCHRHSRVARVILLC